MADTSKKPITIPQVSIPGLGAVPVVAIRLPNGDIALRHPNELQKTVPAIAPAKGGG